MTLVPGTITPITDALFRCPICSSRPVEETHAIMEPIVYCDAEGCPDRFKGYTRETWKKRVIMSINARRRMK